MSPVLPEVSELIPQVTVNSPLEKPSRGRRRLKPVKQTIAPKQINPEMIDVEMALESILVLRRNRVITSEAARDFFEAFKRRQQEARINCF